VKSKDYSDRVKREQACGVLATKVKTVDKNANRDTVVKKNNLLMSLDFFFLATTVAIAT
jgi:hypothetical protein